MSFEKRPIIALSVFSLALALLGASCAPAPGATSQEAEIADEPVDEAESEVIPRPYCSGYRPRYPSSEFESCASRCELAHHYCSHGIAPGTARPRFICNRQRRSCCYRCASGSWGSAFEAEPLEIDE